MFCSFLNLIAFFMFSTQNISSIKWNYYKFWHTLKLTLTKIIFLSNIDFLQSLKIKRGHGDKVWSSVLTCTLCALGGQFVDCFSEANIHEDEDDWADDNFEPI